MKKQRQRARRKVTPLVGRGWAWAIKDHRGRWLLCNWAHPKKECLDDEGKPSPEARKVWVKLVPANKGASGLKAASG